MRNFLGMSVCFLLLGIGSVSAKVEFPLEKWEAGTEVSYIKYEEPGVMEETGAMYGILGSYTYHDRNALMLKAEGKFSYGQVDYDGALSTGAPYTISGINDYMLEFRGLGGYDFFVSETVAVTPYIGFGYRYLNDDSSFDAAGYERESNYYYTPIGIEAIANLSGGWSLGAAVEFDYFWKGQQKSHLEDVIAGLDTLENDQEDGYGLRGSIKVSRKMEKLDLVIEPYIKYWSIDKSDEKSITYSGAPIGAVGYEPKNNSVEMGGKIALKF